MADTLLIHFNPNKADTAFWSLVNNAGELTTMISHGPLSDAASIAKNHKTIVLLGNTSTHIETIHLPIKNRQKLLRAIPYALEEQMADDVDELHFVAGKTRQDGSVPVAAIKKDSLDTILSTINQAGIEPVAIIPDTLCLAANTEQWAILLHDTQAILQFDTFNGSKFDRDIVPTVITSVLQRETLSTPKKILLFTPDGEAEDKSTKDISEALPEDIELVSVSYNTHPLVVYCGQYQNAMPLNLLQEAYKPKSKTNVEWQRWGLAAALAVIWIGLNLGSAGTEYYNLLDKNQQVRIQIEKIYKSTFPKSKKIVNARVQMEQKLNELKGGGSTGQSTSMVTLLSDSASALSSEKGITLQAINYRNNRMDLELTGTNLQAIESLNKKINRKSLKSEIVSSSSEKNQVKGNIRIEKGRVMKQQLETLSVWYHSLSQRDRLLVIATSVIMTITLFYLLIWEPVYDGLAQQQQKYESQQNIVVWMQEASVEAKALQRSGAKTITSSNQPVSLIIEQSAQISGLKQNLGKLESSGKEGARVNLDAASFNQMLIWLNNLEKKHGVIITSANIERGEKPGTVNARLSFSRS